MQGYAQAKRAYEQLPADTNAVVLLEQHGGTNWAAAKRKARGYRTVRNLLAILYFIAGKLRVPCY